MSVVIIDFQGFRDQFNKFVVKELAIGVIKGTDKPFCDRFLFSPPFHYHQLPDAVQRSNNWCTRNLHQLEWYDEGLEYSQLEDILAENTKSYKTICAKGSEKVKFLSQILLREVIDMDGYILRKLSDLPVHSKTKCDHRGVCAVENVLKMLEWVMNCRAILIGEPSQGNDERDNFNCEEFINFDDL